MVGYATHGIDRKMPVDPHSKGMPDVLRGVADQLRDVKQGKAATLQLAAGAARRRRALAVKAREARAMQRRLPRSGPFR